MPIDIAGNEFFYTQDDEPMDTTPDKYKRGYLLYRDINTAQFLVENIIPGIYSSPIETRIKAHQPNYKFIGHFTDWYVCKKVQEEILAKEFSKSQ